MDQDKKDSYKLLTQNTISTTQGDSSINIKLQAKVDFMKIKEPISRSDATSMSNPLPSKLENERIQAHFQNSYITQGFEQKVVNGKPLNVKQFGANDVLPLVHRTFQGGSRKLSKRKKTQVGLSIQSLKSHKHSLIAQIPSPTDSQLTFNKIPQQEKFSNFISKALSNRTSQIITANFSDEIAILKNLQKMKNAMQFEKRSPSVQHMVYAEKSAQNSEWEIMTQKRSNASPLSSTLRAASPLHDNLEQILSHNTTLQKILETRYGKRMTARQIIADRETLKKFQKIYDDYLSTQNMLPILQQSKLVENLHISKIGEDLLESSVFTSQQFDTQSSVCNVKNPFKHCKKNAGKETQISQEILMQRLEKIKQYQEQFNQRNIQYKNFQDKRKGLNSQSNPRPTANTVKFGESFRVKTNMNKTRRQLSELLKYDQQSFEQKGLERLTNQQYMPEKAQPLQKSSSLFRKETLARNRSMAPTSKKSKLRGDYIEEEPRCESSTVKTMKTVGSVAKTNKCSQENFLESTPDDYFDNSVFGVQQEEKKKQFQVQIQTIKKDSEAELNSLIKKKQTLESEVQLDHKYESTTKKPNEEQLTLSNRNPLKFFQNSNSHSLSNGTPQNKLQDIVAVPIINFIPLYPFQQEIGVGTQTKKKKKQPQFEVKTFDQGLHQSQERMDLQIQGLKKKPPNQGPKIPTRSLFAPKPAVKQQDQACITDKKGDSSRHSRIIYQKKKTRVLSTNHGSESILKTTIGKDTERLQYSKRNIPISPQQSIRGKEVNSISELTESPIPFKMTSSYTKKLIPHNLVVCTTKSPRNQQDETIKKGDESPSVKSITPKESIQEEKFEEILNQKESQQWIFPDNILCDEKGLMEVVSRYKRKRTKY